MRNIFDSRKKSITMDELFENSKNDATMITEEETLTSSERDYEVNRMIDSLLSNRLATVKYQPAWRPSKDLQTRRYLVRNNNRIVEIDDNLKKCIRNYEPVEFHYYQNHVLLYTERVTCTRSKHVPVDANYNRIEAETLTEKYVIYDSSVQRLPSNIDDFRQYCYNEIDVFQTYTLIHSCLDNIYNATL